MENNNQDNQQPAHAKKRMENNNHDNQQPAQAKIGWKSSFIIDHQHHVT